VDSEISRRSAKPEPASGAHGDHAVGELVPRRTTLDGFAEEVAGTEGLNVGQAEPLVPILVTTKNSCYRIIPLRRGHADVLVQGGRFFPEPTQARLVGATFGGSCLEMHWIRVGMRMEIDPGTDGGPIITTRVIDVATEREKTTHPRPH
jgi:hypothetical protein